MAISPFLQGATIGSQLVGSDFGDIEKLRQDKENREAMAAKMVLTEAQQQQTARRNQVYEQSLQSQIAANELKQKYPGMDSANKDISGAAYAQYLQDRNQGTIRPNVHHDAVIEAAHVGVNPLTGEVSQPTQPAQNLEAMQQDVPEQQQADSVVSTLFPQLSTAEGSPSTAGAPIPPMAAQQPQSAFLQPKTQTVPQTTQPTAQTSQFAQKPSASPRGDEGGVPDFTQAAERATTAATGISPSGALVDVAPDLSSPMAAQAEVTGKIPTLSLPKNPTPMQIKAFNLNQINQIKQSVAKSEIPPQNYFDAQKNFVNSRRLKIPDIASQIIPKPIYRFPAGSPGGDFERKEYQNKKATMANAISRAKYAAALAWRYTPANEREREIATAVGMNVDPNTASRFFITGAGLQQMGDQLGIDPKTVKPNYALTTATQSRLQERQSMIAALKPIQETVSYGLGLFIDKIPLTGFNPREMTDALFGTSIEDRAHYLAAVTLIPEMQAGRFKAMGGRFGIGALQEANKLMLGRIPQMMRSVIGEKAWALGNKIVIQTLDRSVQSGNLIGATFAPGHAEATYGPETGSSPFASQENVRMPQNLDKDQSLAWYKSLTPQQKQQIRGQQ